MCKGHECSLSRAWRTEYKKNKIGYTVVRCADTAHKGLSAPDGICGAHKSRPRQDEQTCAEATDNFVVSFKIKHIDS